MTGGVGTTFYRAPEQEGNEKPRQKGKGSSYTVQADIFSFGIILFELFHEPFSTYMERAGILSRLRGDHVVRSTHIATGDVLDQASSRFPDKFANSVPKNAQRLILWCLERDPKRRPSATDILASELLPRKIELEQKYLEEALEILTNTHSDSQAQILEALFNKQTREVVDITFDTDINVKASTVGLAGEGKKRSRTPSEALVTALCSIRAGAVDSAGLGSLAMNASSLIAATAALNRAQLAGRLGKGGKGMLKRATQRTAGVLAMRAATAAAVTGAMDGVHGADPAVIENVCHSLKQIFGNHGAVHLKTPLLRPRSTTAAQLKNGGPAELINARGVVLTLPEDLTASLARSVGRGGAATANMKRYDIDRVYHKSVTGGHPRESLEASFDIVQEDHHKAKEIQAEAILVTQQVLSLLQSDGGTLPFDAESPLWFLRIGHTRLTDAILDICGIPAREAPRKYVLDLLQKFSAPSPFSLASYEIGGEGKMRDKRRRDEINKRLKYAVSTHGVPREALKKLEILFMLSPLSPYAGESVLYLKKTLSKLRSLENEDNPKRLKKYEDAARSLKVLSDLIGLVDFHLQPYFSRAGVPANTRYSRPLFVSVDLGMRQRRRTYHGGILFQAIVLPDTYFDEPKVDESCEELVLLSGSGMKVAQGGEFSELVRKNRPPGNFASTFVEHYTASPIPFCFGVNFSIGRLVELLYVGAAMDHVDGANDAASAQDAVQMRKLLGHPLGNARSVDCVVASAHGMDSSCLSERFQVASRLWSDGVSAEYLAHSGIMLSLLKRLREDSEPSNSSDWSLLELYGVCALLYIPFVVIVQPHLLKDKNSVRLVRVAAEGGQTSSESFVSLDNLSNTILGEARAESSSTIPEFSSQAHNSQSQSNSTRASSTNCIFIEHDNYYGGDHDTSRSDTPHWKSILKTMKRVEFQAESFLASLSEMQDAGMHGVVFAVSDASFWALRDFGTCLMKCETEQSASSAYTETAQKYPKYKRSLKTLSVAIDNYMRRQGVWTSRDTSGNRRAATSGTSSLLTVLLYTKSDDRFDVVTLSLQNQPRSQSSRRK
mmetsp:Transcript_5505/g.11681  ORF Transcript_5505/g.11681 Transcript_5505/m.11681 type:complete len:1063 (-) Transcript_5505:710-3898(-)